MNAFRYHMPTEIVFGLSKLTELASILSKLPIKQPFAVTGKNSAKCCGALEKVLSVWPNTIVFDKVFENPTSELCDTAAEICRIHRCDLVIAIGGGSPMDVGKVVAGLVKNEGQTKSYWGSETFRNGALPIVAIPTTSGTGSEVTPYAVIVDSETNTKRSIRDKSIFPLIAILDPTLTVTLPPHITANTGLDALSQAMEGFVSRSSTPLGDLMAIEVCRLIKKWLPVAVQNGTNIEARSNLMYAAMLSGCVIAQSGTTLVHGLGYAFTTKCNVPHGLANALLLTPVFQYNAKYVPEKVAILADALGHSGTSDSKTAIQNIGHAIHTLLAECNISPKAKHAGINKDLLEQFALEVIKDSYRFRNQIGEPTLDDIRKIYTASYEGEFLF